jgi:hypothetical protein
MGEVERKRRIGHLQGVRNRACRHAFSASLDEQAEQRQAVFLRQSTKRCDGAIAVHFRLRVKFR